MASKGIKGITVKIGGDTVGLQKALSDVNRRSGELNAELRQVNNALKFDPTNTTLLSQKQQLLAEQVKNTSDKLQQLRSVQGQIEQQYKSGEIGAEAYRAFQRELAGTESRLASLETEEQSVGRSTGEAAQKTRDFSGALSGLKTAGDTALNAMGTVAGAVGDVMKATAEGAITAGKAATTVGSSFEASVSQIAATMGTSVDNITDLTAKAKELGATTQFSASQAAEGLNVLAMSGLSAEEQTAAIGDVLNLAAAGSLSLSQAASYTTGAIKGFGDTMDNAQMYTDLMAKGATLANTDVNGLGAALSGAAATAKSYGQTADGATLALLRLAEQNVTGSEAATTMNRAMADLYTPTDAAKKALDALGVSTYDQAGNARDFNTVVDELNTSMAGMTDEQQNAYKAAIFTTNGLNAFNKMTASSKEKVDALREGLAKASGSAEEQSKTMVDNLQGDMTMMQSAAEGLGIAFYNTFNGELRENVQFATDSLGTLTEAFEKGGIQGAADAAGQIITQIAGNAADLIPTILEAASTFYSSVSDALISAAPEIAESAGDIAVLLAEGIAENTDTILRAVTSIGATVLSTLPDILGDLVSSAGDFAGSLISFFTRSIRIVGQQLPAILETLAEALTDAVPKLTEMIFTLITTAADTVLTLLPEILPTVVTLVTSLVSALVPQTISAAVMLVQSVADNLPAIISVLTDALPVLIGGILTAIYSQYPVIIDGVGAIIISLAQSLPQMITTIVNMIPVLITQILTAALSSIPQIVRAGLTLFTSLVAALPDIIVNLVDAIPEIVTAIIDVFLENIPLIVECGIELFMALVENLPEIIKGIEQAITKIISGIVTKVKDLHGDLVQAGSAALLKLVDDVPRVIESVKSKAGEIVQGIIDTVSSKYSDLIDAGYNLITGMWQGIENAKDWIIEKIGGFTDSVVDAFKDFFDIHSPSHRIEAEVGEYNGMAIGTGTVKAMPKVKSMIKSATESLFDDSVFTPAMNLSASDLNTVSAPALAGAAAGGSTVINFTMQIDQFDARGESIESLSERAMDTLYRYVQRNKLSR